MRVSPSVGRVKPEISLKDHRAVIFDLDGVVTRTARVHARAWKRLFDDYLKEEASREGEPFVPFNEVDDYTLYLDGKPRYSGVRDFLASRGKKIPQGSPDDGPEKETLCGLGNRKNQWFQQELKEQGVELFTSTIDLIKELRAKGVKIGIISSSRNCTPILQSVGLLDLFDTKIDGVDAAKRHIRGKPAPDIFLTAAYELGVEPRYAVVVEDAVSGVEAGRAGNFALVIGVDRKQQGDLLAEHGADVVVKDLREVSIVEDRRSVANALTSFSRIADRLRRREPVLFLDYDGTLTPIVSHPDLAILDDRMRYLLRSLMEKYSVAIISGRDGEDLKAKLQIDGICYAGSHGFEIVGPGGERWVNPDVQMFVGALNQAEKELRERVAPISGSFVERKRFSIACHYRQVIPEEIPRVEEIVSEIATNYPELRRTYGKRVFELQPSVAWDKGAAVQTLMELLKSDGLPIYIGDDVTDEDAFQSIARQGIGICVQERLRETSAHFVLRNVSEVALFLEKILNL